MSFTGRTLTANNLTLRFPELRSWREVERPGRNYGDMEVRRSREGMRRCVCVCENSGRREREREGQMVVVALFWWSSDGQGLRVPDVLLYFFSF